MYKLDEIAPGDLILMVKSPQDSFFAELLDWGISLSEANPFVHACLVGDGYLIDPVTRVEKAPLDRYCENGWPFVVVATEAQRAAAVTWAERRLGWKYGFLQLAGDFARYDLHWVSPRLYRWKPRHWTCSGFVTAAYASAKVQLTLAPAPSPGDLSYSPLLRGLRPWQ